MARIGLFLALGLCGVAVAGCAKTSGFTAEASPAAAAIGRAPASMPEQSAPPRTPSIAPWNSAAPARRSPWQEGKSRGEVVPGPLYHVNASDCRDFTHTVYRGQPAARDPRHRLPPAERNLAAGELTGSTSDGEPARPFSVILL